jgi:hypothetical protein
LRRPALESNERKAAMKIDRRSFFFNTGDRSSVCMQFKVSSFKKVTKLVNVAKFLYKHDPILYSYVFFLVVIYADPMPPLGRHEAAGCVILLYGGSYTQV